MYEVPEMQLIPQDSTNACWYASTLMVLQWGRRGERMSHTAGSLISPTAHAGIDATHRANNGLRWVEMKRFALEMGLRELPLATPTPEEMERWFRTYGPVWTDGVPVNAAGSAVGTGHVVVLAGIRTTTTGGEHYQILVYDPWPPNVGDVRWRPGSHLSAITSGVARSATRNVCFLVLR
jgi:hypothetical protein